MAEGFARDDEPGFEATNPTRLTHYQRVAKPRIDAGLCRLTKCDGKLYGRGLCKRHFDQYYPGSKLSADLKKWDLVDWDLSDDVLAKQMGITPKGVASARFRHGPRCPECGSPLSHKTGKKA